MNAGERSASGPVVAIVGLQGGEWFGMAAGHALTDADVIIGAARHQQGLANAPDLRGERIELSGPLDQMIDLIDGHRQHDRRVAVLASGDPGFFGIERLLVGRFGDAVHVYPAPSSVALAFARARLNWDDAVVVSCHGRPLELAIPAIVASPKVAVLVSPATPPQAVGQALLAADAPHRQAWVCSHLGEPDESVEYTDLAGLAAGTYDPLSIVVLSCATPPAVSHAPDPTIPAAEGHPPPAPTAATLAWGRPIGEYRHRSSMITKPEVRATALSKLELHPAATLWDVGSASGSVAIEAARLAPGLRAFAIESDPQACEDIRANAAGVAVSVVEATAPACFAQLPNPDRVFVGGGGVEVLDASLARLSPGGVCVATFAVMAAALEAAERLGNLVQLSVSRGTAIGSDGHLRLVGENPVFVVWGIKGVQAQ